MTKEESIRQMAGELAKGDIPGDDESLFDSGALDSFALPDLVSALEQRFGIQVPDSDLRPRNFDTIAKIAAYVTRLGA